jgi:hypothetical protein
MTSGCLLSALVTDATRIAVVAIPIAAAMSITLRLTGSSLPEVAGHRHGVRGAYDNL